jgi:O-antigen ligase
VWPERPVLGYGYGALWNQTSFRLELQELHGWPYPVFFSDNGYLDLLLNLGVIGLVLFLVFFLITGYRTVKHLGQERTPASFFPLMIWTYVGLANLSYSFLLEVDQFVWMLLVMAAVWSAQAAASHATERRQDAARSD